MPTAYARRTSPAPPRLAAAARGGGAVSPSARAGGRRRGWPSTSPSTSRCWSPSSTLTPALPAARLRRHRLRHRPPVRARPRRLPRQHVRQPSRESDRRPADLPAVLHAVQPLGSRAQPHAPRVHEPQRLRLRVDADVAGRTTAPRRAGGARSSASIARHRVTASYYFVEIYLAKLIFPSRAHVPERRPAYRWDSLAVTAFAAAQVAGLRRRARSRPARRVVVHRHCGVVLPFVVWNALMGFAIFLHHTHPDVAWFDDIDRVAHRRPAAPQLGARRPAVRAGRAGCTTSWTTPRITSTRSFRCSSCLTHRERSSGISTRGCTHGHQPLFLNTVSALQAVRLRRAPLARLQGPHHGGGAASDAVHDGGRRRRRRSARGPRRHRRRDRRAARSKRAPRGCASGSTPTGAGSRRTAGASLTRSVIQHHAGVRRSSTSRRSRGARSTSRAATRATPSTLDLAYRLAPIPADTSAAAAAWPSASSRPARHAASARGSAS